MNATSPTTPMRVEIHHGLPAAVEADVLIVPLGKGARPSGPLRAALPSQAAEGLEALLASGDFTGKAKSTLVFHTPGLAVPRLALAGLGTAEATSTVALRRAVGHAVRSLRDLNIRRVAVLLDPATHGAMAPADAAQVATEGALLATYQMREYRTVDPGNGATLTDLVLVSTSEAPADDLAAGARRGQAIAEAAALTRDLVMHPSNVMTPTRMVAEARQLAGASGLEVAILEVAELSRQGFGGLLAVNRASAATEPARLISLTWRGATDEPPIVLVGKGVTFDSGGISIKPAAGMDLMKFDMGGGAAVIGTMKAVAALGVRRHVVALVPVTENMVGGDAYKPGDVITMFDGQTVEITNTDAEGRMILADAMSYARAHLKPQALIDVATLTGACIVALGDVTTGLFANDQALADRLLAASRKAGERTWQLPVWEEYDELLRSDIADMKNSSGRPAGAIAAACFLQRFAGDTPWCHLDIAGSGWAEHDLPGIAKGPTGAPVRTLVEALLAWPEPGAGEPERA